MNFISCNGRRHLHYAWILVIAASIINAITASIRMSFGVFLDPLMEEFGWSRAMTSGIYSLQYIVFAVASLGAGYLTGKYGTRKLAIGGSVLFLASMLFAGRTRYIWELYLSYGLIMGIGLSLLPPIQATVTRWFDQRVGLALGIVTASQGAGTLFIAPLLRYISSDYHWQAAFIFTGIVGGSLAVISSFFIRNLPEDHGLLPYGSLDAKKAGAGRRQVPVSVLPGLVVARRTSTFWLLIAVHYLGCIGHSILLVHIVSYATARGIPGVTAASVLGFVFGCSVVGRISIGILTERIGKNALVLSLISQFVGVLIFLFAGQVWAYFLGALFLGIGFGGETVVFPIINRTYFHPASIFAVYGYQMFGSGLGMATGGYLGGLLFDLAGTYQIAFWTAAVFNLLGILAAVLVKKPATVAEPVGPPVLSCM